MSCNVGDTYTIKVAYWRKLRQKYPLGHILVSVIFD